MTTFAFPTFARKTPFTEWHFGQEPVTFLHSSPLSGQTQTVEMPGTRWAMSMRLSGLNADERANIAAFLAELRGRANRFTLHDLMNPVPRGTMRGTLTVSGNIAAGAVTCSVTGGAGQASTTLLRGDKLNIGGELKLISANAQANGSGVITLNIEPPFRAAVSSGAGVTWDRPTALFMRTEPGWRMSHTPPRFGELALDAIEAFS